MREDYPNKRLAFWCAWRWRSWIMRALGADAEQEVWVGLLRAGPDAGIRAVQREVARALEFAARAYGLRDPHCRPLEMIQHRSLRVLLPQTRRRCAKRTGYRVDSGKHRKARMKVSPARRREIARMGAIARAKKKRRTEK